MVKKSSKVKSKAKKPSKVPSPTQAEKQALRDANAPPKGVKVKVKWTASQVAVMLEDLQTARQIVLLWVQAVQARKAKSWTEIYYKDKASTTSQTLSQLIANLYEVKKEMSW